MASSSTIESKRKQEDVGWEYGELPDKNNRDRVKCKLCGKINTAGINRLKHHIAGIRGNVAPCTKATKEDQIKCRNSLEEIKSRKKSKQIDEKALRDEVRIDGNRIDEMEESFGTMKSPCSFGPMDRLRAMFCSDDWDKCKLSKSKKGKEVFAMVMDGKTWAGVSKCLRVFSPLVKILRTVDADWKPSMGFLHGKLKKAQEEIKEALNNNKRFYEPIMNIILVKMKGRLDSSLHLSAYLLNPVYLYKDPEIQYDIKVNVAITEVVETLYPEDYDMQHKLLLEELPIYKGRQKGFDKFLARKGCEVNDNNYDPVNWWTTFGQDTPHLRSIAIRILSLTTSSSGCERNWSTFEAIHTKKRNRLEATKLNNLVFVQFNANLMLKNQKRKERGHEALLADDISEAQDWILDSDVVGDAMGVDEFLQPRRSARTRDFLEEEFESESEEVEMDDEEYESDGVQILDQYGQDQDVDDNDDC